MNGFVAWLQQLQFGGLIDYLLLAAASLLCIMVHESCHGLAALALGDDTAKRAGRISLNPLRHIDPVGLLMMVLFRFGWAKPVPVDPRRFRHFRSGMALTAAAGPASNVVLAYLALIFWYPCALLNAKNGGWISYFSDFFEYTALLSAGLAVFNLFPVPPLDGSKVVFSLMPERYYAALMRYERYGFLLLMALLVLGVLDTPLAVLRSGLLDGLLFCARPFFRLAEHLIL